MKRVYKTHNMVIWEDEKKNGNSCLIYSIGDNQWFVESIIDNLETTIGEYRSKKHAFKMLQIAMEKLGYTIKL